METSFPKDKIRVVLFEGIHAQGVDMLAREGFDVTALPGAAEGAELASAVADAEN